MENLGTPKECPLLAGRTAGPSDMETRLHMHTIPFLASLLRCTPVEAGEALLTWQTFDDTPARESRKGRIFHGSIISLFKTFDDLNSRGCGVFVCVNETDLTGRQKTNIVKARSAWTDIDGKLASEAFEPSVLPLEPTILIKSGHGYHAYWVHPEALPLDQGGRDFHEAQLRGIQARMANFGADPKVCQAACVLRLPGTFNMKDPEHPILVELLRADGPTYTSMEIAAAFPVLLTKGGQPRSKRHASDPPFLETLRALGLVVESGKGIDGGVGFRTSCPWHDMHTDGVDDSSGWLAVHPDGTPRHWECRHAHCHGHGLDELLSLVREGGVETPDTVALRLSRLTPFTYAQSRVAEAERIGIRVTDLDAEVIRIRKLAPESDQPSSPQGMFQEVEPWPEPVDLCGLLEEIRRTFLSHIVLNEEAAVAAALWVAFTWVIDEVQVAPILAITSPEKRCGKTQMLDLVSRLSNRAIVASNISSSAIFRIVEAHQPALMIDEADTFLPDNEEMRGVLNSGHTRQSAYVVRCVGDDHTPTQFSTWCAKAIALIGQLPNTLADRSINVALRRKLPDEKVNRLRYTEPETFTRLASKLARFGADQGPSISSARPELPEALNDRAQDNWEPLLCIADIAGGEWPTRARMAAIILSGAEREPASTPIELLRDIKEVFALKRVIRIPSGDLIGELCKDTTRPWVDYKSGRPINPRQVATILKEFGVFARDTRFGVSTLRAYHLAEFQDAFDRYLPPTVEAPPATPDTPTTRGMASAKARSNVEGPAPAPSRKASPVKKKVKY